MHTARQLLLMPWCAAALAASWHAAHRAGCTCPCRRTIINAGYSPMSFFAKDYASYFKLAELLSLVDLSLVRGNAHGPCTALCA